jgi:hypothetical protein
MTDETITNLTIRARVHIDYVDRPPGWSNWFCLSPRIVYSSGPNKRYKTAQAAIDAVNRRIANLQQMDASANIVREFKAVRIVEHSTTYEDV